MAPRASTPAGKAINDRYVAVVRENSENGKTKWQAVAEKLGMRSARAAQVKLYRLPKTPDYDRAIITGRRNDKLFGTQRDRTSCSPTTTESSTTEAMTSESWQGTANADFAGDDSFWAALHSQGLKMEENRYETEDEFSSLFDFDGAGDQTVSAIDPKLTMLSESV